MKGGGAGTAGQHRLRSPGHGEGALRCCRCERKKAPSSCHRLETPFFSPKGVIPTLHWARGARIKTPKQLGLGARPCFRCSSRLPAFLIPHLGSPTKLWLKEERHGIAVPVRDGFPRSFKFCSERPGLGSCKPASGAQDLLLGKSNSAKGEIQRVSDFGRSSA